MYYLSESDLLLINGYRVGLKEESPELFNSILNRNGMDTKKPIIEEVVQHRNLRQQAVTCKRYVGLERTDKAWLRSGFASVDAHINSSSDRSLKDELKNMRQEGFSDTYEDMVDRAARRDEARGTQ